MRFSSSPNRPEGWKEMKLGDICKTFTSGGTPSRKKPEYFENGTIPWVRTKELNDGVITEVEEFITPEALRNSSAKLLPKNTVLLAMYGATVGKLGVLGFESSCNQACAAMVPKDGVVDYRFLYYLLLKHRELIISQATGGAQQNLSGELIKGFTFDFPTYKEQEAISEVLWKIDEKIAINNALSKTLEDVAQTIFKSWFIDFDPVKEKMVREKPVGMDAATAAIFPGSMQESELGLIPEGWQASQLKSMLVLHKTTIKAGTATESVPYVPIDQIGSRDIFLKNSMSGTEAKTSLVSFKKNEILFGAMRPYFHKVVLAPFDGTTRTTTFVLRVINPRYLSFALLTLFQDSAVTYATSHSQGTTIPYAVWSNSFENFPLVIPSEPVATAFNGLVLPLLEYGYSLMKENQKLVQIRDDLLPRLISGELQIPEEMLVS
jgi:type I restriction enzyme S subunit